VGVGASTGGFITNLSQQIGCENIRDVYLAAKDSFCCDVMSSIYWMISSWYLIGWSMLICGCGASLLGRKRFPYELWGADIEEDRAKLEQENSQEADGMVDAKEAGDPSGGGDGDGDGHLGLPEMDHSRPSGPTRGVSIALGHAGSGVGSPSAVELDDLQPHQSEGGEQEHPHLQSPHSIPDDPSQHDEPEFLIEPVGDDQASGFNSHIKSSHADEKSHISINGEPDEGEETWNVN